MSTVQTRYEHIVLEDVVPLIAGTTMKVVELAVAQQAHGWSPEELVFQFRHLNLGQVYSALAYYWDHHEEFDREIASRLALADELQQSTPQPPIVARLRAHRTG